MLLSVTDTGTGMSPAALARVFRAFFHHQRSGQRAPNQGLATVFGIVRQSGGLVCVDSVLGQGTTFSVYFPVAAGTVALLPEPVSMERSSLFGTETILLVEDEERVRVLVRYILTKFGYFVLEAQSGGDALLLCEQHPDGISLLLTDV